MKGHVYNLNAIVATCNNWAIGNCGKLLVKNKADLTRFRDFTLGKIVIMGRKTLESLPGGNPLSGRRNIVLTRNQHFNRADCRIVHNVAEVLRLVEQNEAWVIGGGEIYHQLLPYCQKVEVTRHYCNVSAADTFFPDLDQDSTWEKIKVSQREQTADGIFFDFITYRNKQPITAKEETR